MTEERIRVYGRIPPVGECKPAATDYHVKASDINLLIDSYVVGMRKAGRLAIPSADTTPTPDSEFVKAVRELVDAMASDCDNMRTHDAWSKVKSLLPAEEAGSGPVNTCATRIVCSECGYFPCRCANPIPQMPYIPSPRPREATRVTVSDPDGNTFGVDVPAYVEPHARIGYVQGFRDALKDVEEEMSNKDCPQNEDACPRNEDDLREAAERVVRVLDKDGFVGELCHAINQLHQTLEATQ